MNISRYTKLFCLFLFISAGVYAQDVQTGGASYYADKYQGAKTAYGEAYDKNKMTCAHKTYPKGTLLRVSRLDNNKSVLVRVNDRGPFTETRIVDLSKAAAIQLDMIKEGVVQVKVERIQQRKIDRPTISEIVPKSINAPVRQKSKAVAPRKQTPQEYNLVSRGQQINKELAVVTPKSSTPEVTPTPRNLTPRSVPAPKAVPAVSPEKVNFVKPGDRGFGVQMASYSTYANAINLIADLKGKGMENAKLKVIRENDNSRTFKVILAPFLTRAAAVNYMNSQELNGLVVLLAK